MVLPVRRDTIGNSQRVIYRMGVLERRKKTSNKYCFEFYKRAGLKNLLKDLEVDLWQLLFVLSNEKKPRRPRSEIMNFSTEMGRWE